MKNKVILIILAFSLTFIVVSLIFFSTPYRNAKLLVKAIKQENCEEIEKMLNSGVDPNIATTSNVTEFILNALGSTGERPLSVACGIGNLEIVEMLIDYGATAEPYYKCGWSPLRETLFYYKPQDVEIVKILLDNGANPDFVEDELPVFVAADMIPKAYDKNKTNGTFFSSDYDIDSAKGITEIVRILLGDKSVNIQAKSGETLLIKASKRENVYLVEHLVSYGCDTEIKDANGMTALDYAIQSNNKDIIAILDN